ncbi:hypothetical protein EX895_003748 [Sporisorium graminicola]|uniref:Methyltransferase domain-containing protein n=1 Tax=Sporisorium graminicola TaxID=280036 RepID=A0A4U7KRK1_9BASI|nr:hypothetical protein EX895_003748 [Sporisorium graminicola]TKY87071.1 hypothetical protein EX895_003748 [Sporisorium graminicola]
MTHTRAEQLFKLQAVDVAANHIQPASSRGQPDSVQTIQSSHRLDILYAWLTGSDPCPATSAGSHHAQADYSLLSGTIMDLGCGQGDQTGALGALIAAHPGILKEGKVIGVDPAQGDYGSPYTLRQAQDELAQNSQLARHVSFALGKTGPQVLETQTFDTVVLAHSLWYFPSAQVLNQTFAAIKQAGVKHLLLAEWAMAASHPDALPHLLAALLQGQSPVQGANIQTPLSPEQVKGIAVQAGWMVKRELTFSPSERLQDGDWEIEMAREAADAAAKFDASGDKTALRLKQSVQATRYALEEAVKRIGRQERSMDVWTAVLTAA